MSQVIMPLWQAVWIVLAAGFGGVLLGLVPGLLLLWRREAVVPPHVREAEQQVAEINRAAQRAMLLDALNRRVRQGRTPDPYGPPLDGEWRHGGG